MKNPIKIFAIAALLFASASAFAQTDSTMHRKPNSTRQNQNSTTDTTMKKDNRQYQPGDSVPMRKGTEYQDGYTRDSIRTYHKYNDTTAPTDSTRRDNMKSKKDSIY